MVVGRNPGGHVRVDAHARQANLASRAVGVLVGQGGELLFMRAPPHLGRRRPFLAEALDAPGVDELVHLFRPIRDLRVTLAAVNHLDAELVGQVIELLGRGMVRNLFSSGAVEFPIRQRVPGDVQERVFGEMADEPGVGSVLEHRGRARLGPAGHHPPEVHVPPIEGPLGRRFVGCTGVRIPQLHGRVDVENAPVVTPLNDFDAVDVPRQIDEQVAGRNILAEQRAHVLRRDSILNERHALLDPGLEDRVIGIEVHDGDALRIHLDVPQQDGQRAPCHSPKTDEQDSMRKGRLTHELLLIPENT